MLTELKRNFGGASIILASMFLVGGVSAGPLWVGKDTDQLIKVSEEISPLGSEPLGEKIGLYTGGLGFESNDVSVPGNNKLEVAFRRKFTVQDRHNFVTTGLLGDWEIELPRIQGTFAWTAGIASSGWNVATPGAPLNRCSVSASSPANGQAASATGSGGYPFVSYEYWYGTFLEVPGQVSARLMVIDPANQNRPSQGGPYHWVAPGNWVVSCLSSTANGVPGEAFLAHSPDGTKYWFNWSAKRPAPGTQKMATYNAGGAVYTSLSREEVWMLPTRVEDRFGNYVTYTYDSANPARLSSITSSDGRSIAVAYNASGRVASVSSHGRTWSYTYNSSGNLIAVVLPDQSSWQMDLAQLAQASFETTGGASCADPGAFTQYSFQGSITHPSGLRGDFVVKRARHGRSYVPKFCIYSVGGGGYPMESNLVDTLSIVSKTFSGPELPPQGWSYAYGPSNQSYAEDCTSTACATSKWVDVVNPIGEKSRYTFSNRYGSYEGNLLQAEIFDSAGALKRSTATSYVVDPVGQPYPARIGTTPCTRCDKSGELIQPVSQVVVTQDGVSFNRQNQSFDQFGEATTVAKFSSLGARTDQLSYYHDQAKWTLGQLQSSLNLNTALLEYRAAFDLNTALPIQHFSFEKLTETISYHVDGTVATVKDGNNNATSLTDWHRGVPRSIQYADGTLKSVAVSPQGWIESVTNEVEGKTCYSYDAMGRLSRITYPSEATPGVCNASAWNEDVFSFVPTTTQFGIPAGHWAQVHTRGAYRKITHFDALWRPIFVQEEGEPGTVRFRRQAFDHDGRAVFSSYPVASAAAITDLTKGSWTVYDALGRVTASSQDSELGLLTTTTNYAPGFQTHVTNPRNYTTITEYQAYDQPAYDNPTGITQSAGADTSATEIHRDTFGKPLRIRKRNSSGSLFVDRQYVYRPDYQSLCKTIEPETGVTVMDYDGAGNLGWSAGGLNGGGFTSTLDCSLTDAWNSGRRVDRSYDARNRLKTLVFADGLGNQAWTYTPDGLPATITTHNSLPSVQDGQQVINAYAYNRRRLMVGESVAQKDWYAWGVGYGYDANASLASQSYYDGSTLSYQPNALGQPTRVQDHSGFVFASGAQYYPNGAIKQFTYGNGIVHSMVQNARQLPARSVDSGVLDLDTRFDANGNVSDIYDVQRGGFYNRHMQYDGLDRLTAAGSWVFGGDAWHRFTYDALDNMRSWKLSGVKDYADYVYGAQNRLTNIKDSSGATIVSLEYDLQGNLDNKSAQNYDFDIGNRLREVSGKEYYRYDGHGRRVMAWRPNLGSVFSQYTSDGKVFFQWDEVQGKRLYNIYLGNSVVAIREVPIAGGALVTKYQHTDALGSPVAVTNEAGTVIERNDYEPYGAVIGKPNYQGIGYTGHVQDGATGLTYMQQRYYDPTVGRFLSVDPVAALSSPVLLFNRYRYAGNNPYRFTDPDGRVDDDPRHRPGPMPATSPPPPQPEQAPEPKTLETVTVKPDRGFYGSMFQPNTTFEAVGAYGIGGKYKRDWVTKKDEIGFVLIGVGARGKAGRRPPALTANVPLSVDIVKTGFRWGDGDAPLDIEANLSGQFLSYNLEFDAARGIEFTINGDAATGGAYTGVSFNFDDTLVPD